MLHLETFLNAETFLSRTRAALEADEKRNALTLGLVERERNRPPTEIAWYYGAVFEGDRLVVAATKTPHYNVVLAGNPDNPHEVVKPLVEDLQARGDEFGGVPGVNGPAALSRAFLEGWLGRKLDNPRVHRHMRMYTLEQVTMPPSASTGTMRLADESDLDLVTQWAYEFQAEALEEAPLAEARQIAEGRIASREIYLWMTPDVYGPVSMSGKGRPSARFMWINLVYTPPEFRGRGYASACVAKLSQLVLDSGKKFCALFTDLNNPTSNSIYQRMGYQPVCDFDEYRFSDAG